MCGISGIVSKNDINPQMLKKMADAIRHRGPDDEGFIFLTGSELIVCGGDDTPNNVWKSTFTYSPKKHINSLENIKANICLAHRRLSILDLSPSGHQPMCDESMKVWIVFNGEIYNFVELREELKQKGYTFISGSDTEVLLKSYLEYGFDCVNKFNGMWAFAILDLRKNIIFISRDRFGVKPLYYYLDDENFAFSSEIKSLLKLPFIKKEVNYEAVFDYLAFGWEGQSEESFFKGIKEIKPANNILINLNNLNVKIYQYYELSFYEKFERFDELKEKQFSSEIKDLIYQAIKLRLRSDVKVGSCLSGGLDSSTIVCVMDDLLKKENLSQIGESIKCFTASYVDDKVDESRWAKIVVDNTHSDWIRTYPTGKDLLTDLEDLVHTQDVPFGSTSIYAQYRVMKAASENGVKVLLDGQGGDELFTGYIGYYPTFYRELIRNFDIVDLYNEIKSINNSPVDLKFIFKSIIKTEIAKNLNNNFLKNFLFKNKTLISNLNNFKTNQDK